MSKKGKKKAAMQVNLANEFGFGSTMRDDDGFVVLQPTVSGRKALGQVTRRKSKVANSVAVEDLKTEAEERKEYDPTKMSEMLDTVEELVKAGKYGKAIASADDVLMEEREHVNVSFTVNDLNHLQRGGRVSKTTAVVGSLVNIKPILNVTSTGELKSDGTVRGRKKSLKTLVSRMEASLDLDHYGKDRLVCVLHGDCYDEAKSVADMVKELGFTNVIINDVSPSIGTHAGPGVVGLVSYGKKR